MYAPVFSTREGKRFIVADKDLVFKSWINAASSASSVISDHRWSLVSFSGEIVELNDSLEMKHYVYMNTPVMVLS